MNTLNIENDGMDANFSGHLKIEVLDSTETKYLLSCNTYDLLKPFWIDKADAETDNKIDPNKVIRWLMKKLNKYFNGQQED
jgi:hypothetical protein